MGVGGNRVNEPEIRQKNGRRKMKRRPKGNFSHAFRRASATGLESGIYQGTVDSRRSADSFVRVLIPPHFPKRADRAVRAPFVRFLNPPYQGAASVLRI